jgi:hypothetical protein
MRPFYVVTVNGISVDGELLEITFAIWDIEKGGDAILAVRSRRARFLPRARAAAGHTVVLDAGRRGGTG